MAVAFNSLCYWLSGSKNKESSKTALHSSSDFNSVFREADPVNFLSMNGPRMRSSSRKFKKKRQSREERRMRVDREYDVVIVPSDGGCLSGSESDDSDWSIGWIEPHGSDFQSNSIDEESSFAVLVPCYGRGRCEKTGNLKRYVLGSTNHQNGFSSDSDDYMERWLATLQST